MRSRVLVLQHAEPEHLGLIAQALEEAEIGYECLRTDQGGPVPATLDGYQGLVIMGGPQSVYEEDAFPYLKAEKTLARRAIAAGLPALGVCLGSQILAEVLGAEVRPSSTFELGWRPVTLSSEARRDPVLGCLPERVTALHWHGDVYDLPPGTRSIGSSDMTPVQGFVAGANVYGLLFHLEAAEEQVWAMAQTFPQDVVRGGLRVEELLAQTQVHAPALRKHALAVFRAWAGLVDRQDDTAALRPRGQ
jgi:GMP synthase (glutamine-hydrolysing)